MHRPAAMTVQQVATSGYGESVRSVVVYSAMDRCQAVTVLDRLAQQREPYHIDGCLHVDVVDDSEDLPLFLGWEPEEIEALERVVGHRPTWSRHDPLVMAFGGSSRGPPGGSRTSPRRRRGER